MKSIWKELYPPSSASSGDQWWSGDQSTTIIIPLHHETLPYNGDDVDEDDDDDDDDDDDYDEDDNNFKDQSTTIIIPLHQEIPSFLMMIIFYHELHNVILFIEIYLGKAIKLKEYYKARGRISPSLLIAQATVLQQVLRIGIKVYQYRGCHRHTKQQWLSSNIMKPKSV